MNFKIIMIYYVFKLKKICVIIVSHVIIINITLHIIVYPILT